ncbi:MAG: DUF4344 domain-containing metallopeptidase [Paracoccaceae bacterium]|nr:DUF4344 domain-containing metallopeptidase [Paracoccaceae bacterium]
MLRTFLIFLLTLFPLHIAAEVIIEPNFQSAVLQGEETSVPAGSWSAFPLEVESRGQVTAHVQVSNDIFTDGSAYICSDADFGRFKNGQNNGCSGYREFQSAVTFSFEAPVPERYWLLLDNRESLVVSKEFVVSASVPKLFDQSTYGFVRELIQGFDQYIRSTYILPKFDVFVESCGQSNAFSDIVTGDITVCSEFVYEAITEGKPGALIGIMLHELGHSALNLWNLPNFRNEETVDEFATYILMQSDAEQLIPDFVSFFTEKNSWSEAQRIISTGGPHPLSVQRARNILLNQSSGHAFTERWNLQIYPFMTTQALQQVAKTPGKYDNPNLARQILQAR